MRDLRKTFVSWDTNNDGYLTYAELKQNMEEISNFFSLGEPDVQLIMAQCDTNNDGKIEYTEFVTAAFDK